MADVQSDLRTYLLDDATLSGLIGARLYPVTIPQNPTMPAVSFSIVSGERPSQAQGPTDLSQPRFQFDCWGSTYAEAESVFNALKERLNGSTSGNILCALFDSERDFYEEAPELYRRSADFFIWYNEG